MGLDLRTLVITEALILMQLAALLYVAGQRMRDIVRGPTAWAVGVLGFAIAQLLFVLLDTPGHGPSKVLGYLPAALGSSAVLIGFDDFTDRHRQWRGISVLLTFVLLDSLFQAFVWTSFPMQAFSFSLVQLAFVALVLPRLYRKVPGQQQLGFKLMRFLAWGWGAINLARMVAVAISPIRDSQFGQTVQLAYFIMSLFFGIWLVLGCWWLMHERLTSGLMHATTRDALTGSHNARGFADLLQRESSRLARHWSPTSVMRVMIDDFATLCSNYGSIAGDQVLVAFADVVHEELRDVDGLARLEIDQFAILLLNADKEGAATVAERLHRRVKDLVVYSPAGPIWFTASVGVASLPNLETELSLVFKQAEHALFQAHRAGADSMVMAPSTT
ncbi:GGDEF domain-containing protein [Chitinimonas sp. PSY-7]|uniref:diguanylate cyclase n=1 Tax=Chitinimonas sp. PSY-7 TaxID=3459088 RepID=UPI00403FE8BF